LSAAARRRPMLAPWGVMPIGLPPSDTDRPFDGWWRLVRDRSEAPTAHLEGMGLPEMAQTAAARIEPTYHIVQHRGGDGGPGGAAPSLTITHQSELGTRTRALVAGATLHEVGGDGGAIRIQLELGKTPTSATITTDWTGRGRITDRRELLEGGTQMQQRLEFVHKGASGKTTSSTRLFVRIAEPAGDALAVAAAAAAAPASAARAGDGVRTRGAVFAPGGGADAGAGDGGR